MESLHCSEPQERQESCAPCILRLVPFERLETVRKEQQFFVNLHGSIIVQQMLEFNKPIKTVSSILSMPTNELEKVFCDPKGSHIVDSYMKSQYIGEKNREKLIRKMKVCRNVKIYDSCQILTFVNFDYLLLLTNTLEIIIYFQINYLKMKILTSV